jgi:hypothetical protein
MPVPDTILADLQELANTKGYAHAYQTPAGISASLVFVNLPVFSIPSSTLPILLPRFCIPSSIPSPSFSILLHPSPPFSLPSPTSSPSRLSLLPTLPLPSPSLLPPFSNPSPTLLTPSLLLIHPISLPSPFHSISTEYLSALQRALSLELATIQLHDRIKQDPWIFSHHLGRLMRMMTRIVW